MQLVLLRLSMYNLVLILLLLLLLSVYFFAFGSPPLGTNGGNTPASTFKVLNILKDAMKSTTWHRDGGWDFALQVT